MSRPRPIVAIDGPAASGKSTLARALARRFGLIHVDTGAMYRTVALRASESGIAPDDDAALERFLGGLRIRFEGTDPDRRRILEGDEDVSEAIRTPEVSALASRYSANPVVRRALVRMQRDLGAEGGLVLDGRDVGSVVFPDAEVKVFLDADEGTRAERRSLELGAQGVAEAPEETRRSMAERDRQDRSRAHAPLTVPEGAVVLDSTDLGAEQVLAEVSRLVEAALADA